MFNLIRLSCKKRVLLTTEQKQFILIHENDDVRTLALRFSREDMPFLLSQIVGRQIAKRKIPSWYPINDIVYPVHLSLEQASSEMTAQYKASLFPSLKNRLVDLTGGLGVDFSFLSPHFSQAIYVEQLQELCVLGEHNFAALRLKNVLIKNTSSESFLETLDFSDVIFLDPARRDGIGRKVFLIEDCSPNLLELKEKLLAKSEQILIKYSPMLDISLGVKTLGNVREVHIVSVENECKELLFLLSKNPSDACVFHAVNLRKRGETESFSFKAEDERKSNPLFTSQVETYLYEPNASLLKAGAFNFISTAFTVKKLHKNSHLYTSNCFIADFPGRIFKVKNTISPNKKNIRHFASQTYNVNIAVRNYPMSVAEIRKQSGLQEGGNTYLFATTLADNKKVWIVCEKVEKE